VLAAAAAYERLDLTSFVMRSALLAAEEIVARHERVTLSARDSARVLNLLEHPPAAALRAAARRRRRTLVTQTGVPRDRRSFVVKSCVRGRAIRGDVRDGTSYDASDRGPEPSIGNALRIADVRNP
jgi:uncharacterized protein (DUF1778 family)